MDSDQPANFICRFCKCSFSKIQYLFKHVQQVHTARPPTKNSRTCPICGIVFGIGGKNESYKTHLRHIHGQRDEGQIFTFRCFNDFFLWKTELEKRSSCKYALQSAPKVLPTNEKIHVYQCDQTSHKKKKFNVSNISSSKCPAMICATENMKNLEIKVDYWNTHVGHSVQVEQDELNAAISSVQEEDSHVKVMDMLNSIGQGVETGAEVFVTETLDESIPSTSSSRNIPMNMFNIKRGKSTKVNLPQTSPIVPNFSFKKDPSKKKESSIYSLASVACGKVSANKVNINKSASAQFQDLVKNIAKKNSGTIITHKATVASERSFQKEADSDKTNDSFNNEFPSNDIDLVSDTKEASTTNIHPSSIGGRYIAINPMPPNKPSSSELNISNEISSIGNLSETLTGKSMSDKENFSLVSNKNSKSLNKTTSRSLLKSNTKNAENSISTKNGILEQNSKSLGVINTDTPQIILASVPVPQPNLSSLIGTKPGPSLYSAIAQSPNPTSHVVSPMTQTYLSIDNKLIPVVNAPGTALNPNLGSGIILSSALPQFTSGQMAPMPLPTLTPSFTGSFPGGLFSSNKPLLAGANEKSTSSQAQSVSSLSTSFSNAPVVLIPYTNSSPVPSLLQSKPSASLSSPMVLQTVRPMTSLSTNSLVTNSLGNLGPNPLAKTVPVALGKFENSPSTDVASSSNTLKVQKVSLPTANSTHSATSSTNVVVDAKPVSSQSSTRNPVTLNSTTVSSTPDNSKTASSQPSLGKPVALNSKTKPNVNISKIFESKNHKPGTFVFESSGELFMLEPVDDDLVIKKNTTPVTSTPLKKNEISITDSTTDDSSSTNALSTTKRKHSPEDGSDVKYKKFKEVLSSKQGVSAVYDASTKSAYIVNDEAPLFSDSSEDNSNSCASGISNSHKDSDDIKSKSGSVLSSKKAKISTSETSVTTKTSVKVQNKTFLPEGKSKTKHSPFTNLFPTKSSSMLTVKTVPSLAMQPSKPIASFISSTRTQASNLILSSSSPNYISSIQNAESSTEQTTSKVKNMSDNTCTSEPKETSESELEKQPEVKRGVTIKSVVQEKRCITDSDIEIMKKVKFYKLEMQYYSCQEECKKLKIELAKSLSKNKELMQIIEDLKKNENSVKENADVIKKSPLTKECATENNDAKVIHNVATTDGNSKDNNTKDNQDLEILPPPKEDFLKQSGDEESICDTVPEMCDINSDKVINIVDENSNKSETVSIPDTPVAPNTDSITSDQEMIDMLDENNDDNKAKDESIPDTIIASNTIDITSEEMIGISDESSDSGKAENVKENIYHTDLKQNKLDESKDNTVLSVSKEISEKESSSTSDSEMVFKEHDNTKADVYTMVRTSVLRNLYLDIDDLCREKRKLLEDVENLKKFHPEFVPSILE
ncbi:uncharacterized protein [Parasteatoda tepidariorum]|uniref:uncharacterized protein isoform X2 n=1 Tax=Parasteatoda tepidariorum TaxID=114398 RepID=UPI00077FBA82|nr:flocculation protein FLO11 isoform X2 [Parasteatoda tepidariorum]